MDAIVGEQRKSCNASLSTSPAPTFYPVNMATTRACPTIAKTNRRAILDKNKSLAKGA